MLDQKHNGIDHHSCNEPDSLDRLLAANREISNYRAENNRLAKELNLTRRTIRALLGKPGTDDTAAMPLHAQSVPREVEVSDRIQFCMDVCDVRQNYFEISGWAFSPDITCGVGRFALWLVSKQARWIVYPRVVRRPDVREHFMTRSDLAFDVAQLELTGFACLVLRSDFPAGVCLDLELQIDGPEHSVRRPLARRLNA